MIFKVLVPFFVSAVVSLAVNIIYYNKKHKVLSNHYLAIREELKPYLKQNDILKSLDTTLFDLAEGKTRIIDIPFEKRIQNRHYYLFACRHDARISMTLYSQNLRVLKIDLEKSKDINCKIDKSFLALLSDKEVINSFKVW